YLLESVLVPVGALDLTRGVGERLEERNSPVLVRVRAIARVGGHEVFREQRLVALVAAARRGEDDAAGCRERADPAAARAARVHERDLAGAQRAEQPREVRGGEVRAGQIQPRLAILLAAVTEQHNEHAVLRARTLGKAAERILDARAVRAAVDACGITLRPLGQV